ncbi:MAG TPA: hypothetical protein EYH02_03150 [Ignisphaera aggregans]|uniref:Uncharacterized protein n=1 Tax=Ignisphaera aggregans TaxID=334771 RepID=A0A833DUC2_9CREN|nr:hypothetical protein [Ignisphaera aggregans]
MMKYFSADRVLNNVKYRDRDVIVKSCEKLYTRFCLSKNIVVRTKLGASFHVYHVFTKDRLMLFLTVTSISSLRSDSITVALIVDSIMESRSRHLLASYILLTLALILLTNLVLPSVTLLLLLLAIGLALLAISYMIIKRTPRDGVVQRIEEIHRELMNIDSRYRSIFTALQSIIMDLVKVLQEAILKNRERGCVVIRGCGLYEFRAKRIEDSIFDIDMWRVHD